MVHNGVEYGMMAAIAEGLSIIKHADAGLHPQEVDAETTPLRDPEYYRYEIDIPEEGIGHRLMAHGPHRRCASPLPRSR